MIIEIDNLVSKLSKVQEIWKSYLYVKYANLSRDRIPEEDLEELTKHFVKLSFAKDEMDFKFFFKELELILTESDFEKEFFFTETFVKKIILFSNWTELDIYNRFQKYFGENTKDLFMDLIKV